MTVRAGREFLAIPGPTTMPDQVLQAMHRPALDIYSAEMFELTESLLRDLSKLFATMGKSYIYIANGHGAWEATLSNVLSRGDKVLVLESGRFAIGWGQAAAAMGADVEVLKGNWRRAIRPAEVEERLRGFRDAIEAAEGVAGALLPVHFVPQMALTTISDYLGIADGVDGIFAASDTIAMMTIQALADRGRAVPADVKVVGFDDLDVARHTLPPLTSVRQDLDKGAKALVDTLLALLRDEDAPSVLLTPTLAPRASTGAGDR